MLSTAIALQEATKEAVHNDEVMDMAAAIYHNRHEISQDEFIHAMYMYSATLAAVTTTLVTSTLLTESQMDEMMESIKEMEALGKDILNGNE